MTLSESNKRTWDIKQRQAGAVTVVEVSGHLLEGGGSDQLEEELQKLIATGCRFVLLESGQVDSIDSSGVGALVRCFISLEKQGGKLKFLKMAPVIRAAFQLVGMIDKVEIFDDEATALRSFN